MNRDSELASATPATAAASPELTRAARELATALQLQRPLVVFDLEATGLDPSTDRIVELGLLRIEPDGTLATFTQRLDPGIEIPADATAVHGIDAADVRGAPVFGAVVPQLRKWFDGADIAGFNIERYDIPLLEAELQRAGAQFDLTGARRLDACTIFKRMEPRSLAAAYTRFVGDARPPAHTADGDAAATLRVLGGQLAQYPELPRSVDALADRFERAPRP